MDVAVLANCKFFLATACVQACVEGYWKGNLRCKVLNIIWCLINPIAINSLDVMMPPDPSDLGSESEGKEDTEQVNGGIAQVQTAEHETLLDKEPTECENLEHEGDSPRGGNGGEDENLEVVFHAPQKHGRVDNNGGQGGAPKISYCRKFVIFYTAPVTKFITHSTAYILFLLMYSWMVLNIGGDNK